MKTEYVDISGLSSLELYKVFEKNLSQIGLSKAYLIDTSCFSEEIHRKYSRGYWDMSACGGHQSGNWSYALKTRLYPEVSGFELRRDITEESQEFGPPGYMYVESIVGSSSFHCKIRFNGFDSFDYDFLGRESVKFEFVTPNMITYDTTLHEYGAITNKLDEVNIRLIHGH